MGWIYRIIIENISEAIRIHILTNSFALFDTPI
jgi:hypothetical protein